MLSNKKMFTGLAALLSVLVIGVAACGGDDDDGGDSTDTSADAGADAGAGEGQKVVFSVYSDEPPFILAAIKGLEARAEETGTDLTVLVDENDPAAQVAQIENALAQEPDGIIIWANDLEAPEPVAREAADQGVRVITLGQDFSDPTAREAYIGPDYTEVGREKAERLVELMGGEGKLGIIRGIQGADFTEKMAAGADPVFEAAEGIEIVDLQYAGAYTTDAGLTVAENMFTANPDITGLWVDNDPQGVGANQAAEARDLLDQMFVVSTDGDEAGLVEVAEGRTDLTMALCGVEDGFFAIDAILSLLNGETLETVSDPIPDRVPTNVVPVTPDSPEEEIPVLAECN